MVKVDIEGALGFINNDIPDGTDAEKALEKLGQMDDTGWMQLPKNYNAKASHELKAAAEKISAESDVFVVVGVGGSYLGARAMLEFVKSPFYNSLPKETPDILFAGNNASGEYLQQVIALIGDRDFSVNIVSKSGSTIEPSIALRVFKDLLESRYGLSGLKDRLYVTTDKKNSPLRETAAREGYACFEMPTGVGGRYSVLTAVGLLPAAVAGVDIDELMSGAREEQDTGTGSACLYAATRQALYRSGKKIELLACFEPAFRYMGEWWKQLFGESEGKAGLGIFPAYADYTADLHSLGQYVQEGERTLMETLVSFEEPRVKLVIPGSSAHEGRRAALAGMDLNTVTNAASRAVKKAHIDGGVPVVELILPRMSAASFGALAYFFERSCAVSALISGVNPFGQPGVEAYKKNLFSFLNLDK